jgi:hypothetical protein
MSKFEVNEGQIFIHAVKAEGNKPTVKGSMKINGQEYEISLWPSKSGKQGSFSGKVQLPFKQRGGQDTHKGMTQQGDIQQRNDDQEIPW